jgi:hypothetical protein
MERRDFLKHSHRNRVAGIEQVLRRSHPQIALTGRDSAHAASAMALAGETFLKSLSPEKRELANLPFENDSARTGIMFHARGKVFLTNNSIGSKSSLQVLCSTQASANRDFKMYPLSEAWKQFCARSKAVGSETRSFITSASLARPRLQSHGAGAWRGTISLSTTPSSIPQQWPPPPCFSARELWFSCPTIPIKRSHPEWK